MTLPQDRAYLDLCYEYAKKSTCSKARVGAIIVVDGNTIAGIGWNQTPNTACEDCANLCAGGIRKGVKSGTRLELCYAVHAEQWAIHRAGPFARGATIYIASFDENWNKRLKDSSLPLGHPMHGFYCSMCARAVWMAGISRIVTDGINGIVEFTPEEIWNTSYGVAGSI